MMPAASKFTCDKMFYRCQVRGTYATANCCNLSWGCPLFKITVAGSQKTVTCTFQVLVLLDKLNRGIK
jgi:hypothetical protein